MDETFNTTCAVSTTESVMSVGRGNRWMIFCYPLFFIILVVYWPDVGLANSKPRFQNPLGKNNVLILNAFESNIPAFQKTNQGLSAALQSGGIGIRNQFYEHLDLVRNPGPENRRLLLKLMRQRYGHRKIDFIITLYPEALKFVLDEGQAIFSDAPVLALFLPQGFELSKTGRRITPHLVIPDLKRTLEIALKLVPKAERVYVVGGTHPLDRWLENLARKDFKKWEGRLEFRYLDDLPLEKILATVSSAPADSIVFITAFDQDVTEKYQTTVEVSRQLARVSNAPVFGFLDTLLGQGIVGGSLLSFEYIGTRAGEMALDILRGTRNTENLPIVLEVPQLSMFDWRQLRHWNLSESALPRGSIIVNREFSLWDLRYYAIGVLVFILAQSFLIVALFVQKLRRRSAEEASRESERILRQNENDLRRLAGRLINAQEEERSRLARELHDDLAQRLAVFAIDVGQLEQQLVDPPDLVQEELRKMKKDIVKISQDVHNLSRQLHPSILDDLGLIKAVESECTNFSKREGIEIVFNHENIPTGIPKGISLSLYRIIQEGLSNISKHACADHISVSLKGIGHDVLLSVEDDGIGFDSAEVKKKPGLGFSSMRERASLIHGEFSISSQPERVTVITVRVPLTRKGE